jgi:hypothetical protein
MMTMLAAGGDRQGHAGWTRALLVVAIALGAAGQARAADYFARRFDVVAAVAESGDLRVTERIVFNFESGTFKRVWREIPAARTDGIDVVEALMDGSRFTPGDGPGHISVSGRSRVRVEWQFAPTGPSQHTFELRYVARGVVYRDGGRDVLRWRLLPAEHRYAIADSVSTIVLPIGPIEPTRLESRRVEAASAGPDREGIRITASGIGANGWVIADLRFEPGRIVTATPQWQQRQQYALAMAPKWGAAGAGIFLVGLVLVLTVRQGYSTPTVDVAPTTLGSPPEPLPAGLAAVLAAKGRASGYSAVATLLDLADRGVLRIAELPRTFGVRNYEVSQVPGSHELDAHETEAIRIAFGGRGDPVSFSRARGRLARGARRFSAAVNTDLAARGLLDVDRKQARDRLTIVAVIMLLTGALACVAAAPFIPRFDGWPFLLPLALVAAGLIGIVMAASMTPLSDEGLLGAAAWRGFRRHLKAMAQNKDASPGSLDSRWIVYGIALGLAYQLSRFLRRHQGLAPDWFLAAAQDEGTAFAAFVGSHAVASGGSTGGGGGGGAAGGGGSGAG